MRLTTPQHQLGRIHLESLLHQRRPDPLVFLTRHDVPVHLAFEYSHRGHRRRFHLAASGRDDIPEQLGVDADFGCHIKRHLLEQARTTFGAFGACHRFRELECPFLLCSRVGQEVISFGWEQRS